MALCRFKLNTFLISFLLLFFTTNFVSAGQENIRFQRITLEQGLSQETILAAHQDKEGFMWFGTQEGLNRFDGYQFKVFTHNAMQSSSVSSDWIYAINETEDGELWVGSRSGVNVFDKSTQTFSHFKHSASSANSLSEDTVRTIFRDSNNNMWVGTHSGLNKYRPSTKDFIRYTNLTKTDKIVSIAEDISGAIWLGTDGDGLYLFDPVSEKVLMTAEQLEKATGFSGKQIRSLYVDSKKRLWIGTYGEGVSVVTLNDGNLKERKYDIWTPSTFNGLSIFHIYSDLADTIWVASDTGLYRYETLGESFQLIKHEPENPYSLSTNKITYLYQDRGGVFWVGSYSGLNKWNTATAKFDHIRVNSNLAISLTANSTNTFYDAGDKNVWIGTLGGLNLLNTQSGEVKHYRADSAEINTLRSDKVMALYARSNDELWIGYRDRGLSLLNRKNGDFTHFSHDPDDETSIGSNAVSSMLGAKGGKVWLGVFGAGLNLLNPGTGEFKRYQHDSGDPQSISSNNVLSITRDSKGLLWLGTWGGGISIFNPTTATSMKIPHDSDDSSSLGSDVVWSIYEDKGGNIWVGTQGAGLNKLSAENLELGLYKFERVTRNEGLPSNVVYGIIEDDEGFLWLSTNRGISKYDPISKQLLNYDSSHGLQGNEFNSGAYYKTNDGKMYFGGTNGVASFYPGDISPNSHVPPVVLTKFQKLNEVVSIDSLSADNNKIQISHKDYLIAFEFAGLDFASPSNNQYMYMLEGFDAEWIEAADVRKATYTNLPAGSYIFRVKASNNDGIWNEQGTAVALTVLPAPWYSWWAYLIYSFIALAMLYWIYRSYMNKLQEEAKYRQKLEEEVELRTVELSSANEQLLSASITDQLTGLNNRRYLNNVVEQQCSSVMREFEESLKSRKADSESGPRLFFLMFDLDGFKPINDTYGHDAGDKVIFQVGEVLKSVCRKSDTVIRWGGDEFLVMGRAEESSEVEVLAERLRDKIASNGFDIDLKQKMYLSCSIGYSLYPFSHHYPNALSWEQVHLLADNALYKSKEAGRNKWTGILQTPEKPPVNVMNTLTQNIESVIENDYVRLKQSQITATD